MAKFHHTVNATVHLFVCLLLLLRLSSTLGQILQGRPTKCNEEGKDVYIPYVSDNPCISCKCQNKIVTCSRRKCPSMEGCHGILFDKPRGECCDTCKGCLYRGKRIKSGQQSIDPNSPCDVRSCQAGVLTHSVMQCQVLCQNPTQIPGQCCPVCAGCSIGNTTVQNGEQFQSPKDPCFTCKCMNGTISCAKRACPILNCIDRFVHTEPGACCPSCKGRRRVFHPRRACLFRRRVFLTGTSNKPDTCTTCTCQEGTMLCDREVCPSLTDCDPKDVYHPEGQCCRRCKMKPKKQCNHKGKIYNHGRMWKQDTCTSCSCDNGTVQCQMEQCTNNKVECPKNQRLQYVKDKCCPECVEIDAVCTVFGDPHYRTFDGVIYNFQGTCSYTLAKDCKDGNFTIRVRNDARLTNNFAWTRSVSVRIHGDRIHLRQKLITKINRKSVILPYTRTGVYDIVGDGHTVNIHTSFGVKVVWDGDSYLEVTVPPAFKNKMCGLCGNFNSQENDDFIGRDGIIYFDSNDFGETWRVGGKKSCKGQKKKVEKKPVSPCRYNQRKRQRAQKSCSHLRGSVFAECRKKLDVKPYYKSCITDMCDCPKGQECACEALTAYARACNRQGLEVKWRTPSLCGEPSCPRGSRYNVCASGCPRTCDNWKDPIICNKPCVAKCQCKAGLVQLGVRCIKPSRCAKLKQKRKKS